MIAKEENFAVASRVFQFCAGPEHQLFYACEEHRDLLYHPRNFHNGLFLELINEPVLEVDPEQELACEFCREG